jgi:hypothetical protein
VAPHLFRKLLPALKLSWMRRQCRKQFELLKRLV